MGGMYSTAALRRVLAVTWANTFVASALVPPRSRSRLLKGRGVTASKTARMLSGVAFLGDAPVILGDGAFVNSGVVFDNTAPIHVGKSTHLAHQVLLVTNSHELWETPERRAGQTTHAPIHIGDGCWLGARVTVLPGVTIGDGSVVAAGAVVTEDLPPNGLYGGLPARLIRRLPA